MKNNPLNGYQPDYDVVTTADAQEHEIEHAQKTVANAAETPATDAATIDPDTGEIVSTTDAAAAHDDETDDVAPAIHYPTCRFCGKQTIPVAPYKTDADADEAATLKCDCFDARQYQSEVDRKKEREENIKKLRQRLCDFSAYTTARGMELAGDLYDFLLNVGTNVLDAKVAGATIKVWRFTVKFSVGSKSALSITFTYSDGAKLEV